MTQNNFHFDVVLARLKKAKSDLPLILSKQAENFWTDNFKKEEWEGKAWKVPQRRIPGTDAFRFPKKKGLSRRTKRTLIGTGRLRRAVSRSARSRTFERIVFIVDLPYAAVHNDGGRAGRGAGFDMPQRQYMGDHKELRKKQIITIEKEIKNIWP